MNEETKKAATSWPMWILAALALLAVGIGVYMTKHHEVYLYGGEGSQMELVGCAEAEGVSCDIVNTSEWSEVLGVPLFTWAVPTYLLLAGLSVLVATGRRKLLWVIAGGGVGAVLFSGFLYYISKVELGYVCLWCMRLYAINLAWLAAPFLAGLLKTPKPSMTDVGKVAGAFAVLALVSVGVQRSYRSSLLGDGPELARLEEVQDAPPEGEGPYLDPEGPAPELAIDVKTEDDNDAVLRTRSDDAWKGSPDAKVTIVEFADLECGYCKRSAAELRKVYEAYKDDVVFVFKHYPLDPGCNPGVNNRRHGDACNAAVAASCAADQRRFWDFHDLAFKNQHQLEPEHLVAYAEKLELDMGAFMSCVRDPETLERVRQDGEDGKAIDLHGTPRIWIDGKLYRAGTSAMQLARAVEMALGKNAREATEAARGLADEREAIAPVPEDGPEMQQVTYGDLSFFIDTFEASLQEGKAHSGKHEIPGTRMSWFAAKDACEAAGKRLCTEEEWIAACQGARPVDDDDDGQLADDLIEGTAYPYSDYHDRRRCWDGRDRDEFRPVYTGEMPGCVSKDGVYDLTGNMEEWVGATPETAVLLGGAFDTSQDHARCYRRNDTFGPGFANRRTGFRCCRSAE